MSRIDKDTKEEREAAVQNLWLRGYTQEEIAEAVGMPQRTIADKIDVLAKQFPGTESLKLSKFNDYEETDGLMSNLPL